MAGIVPLVDVDSISQRPSCKIKSRGELSKGAHSTGLSNMKQLAGRNCPHVAIARIDLHRVACQQMGGRE